MAGWWKMLINLGMRSLTTFGIILMRLMVIGLRLMVFKTLSGEDGADLDILKDDLLRFMVDFHSNGKLTKGVNSTFIILIPKVANPPRVAEFRPISLIEKCDRGLISDTQSAFIAGRQILDGILIENELRVMVRMQFPMVWGKWIIECFTTSSASVLVNGSPTDEFKLERGLRQGDPLSPFLFLIATEGFSVLMNAMVRERLYTWYKVGNADGGLMSHLQFADDTLLTGVKS
ncbi:uncharacterized protein LOC131594443 [Vicia villosa]|uniref:uncharacterized protein LOC131594443 n=1 Tax=Vicia villosa TaxID=3911 RepID=UPI00273B7D73|nr:uncharacterized protein LOC131594443 [Vicia villosa]